MCRECAQERGRVGRFVPSKQTCTRVRVHARVVVVVMVVVVVVVVVVVAAAAVVVAVAAVDIVVTSW